MPHAVLWGITMLFQVPRIEPLVCKRVATEHLTSILFKKECILLACNEGNIQVRSLTPPIRFVIIQITAFNPVFGYDR